VLSARYACAAAAFLLVAAIPTALNAWHAPAPLEPGTLAAKLAGFGEPGARQAGWVLETFGAEDFATRSCGGLELFAARSYDGKRLFHFPELALTYGRAATAERDAPLPARVLEFDGERNVRVAAYALVYGRRAVERPISFYLSILPELFLGRREPMTLVYVQGEAPRARRAALEEGVLRLLEDAVESLAR
jgi:hypothetical protein